MTAAMATTTKPKASFSPELFSFLRELQENNDREWFKANKARYEEAVQEPALQFIADFAPRLRKISPHFRADARPVGGSLFRIYRDTRFSRDKSPYKTHTGIQFRHELGRDVHAPGFYLHLGTDDVFVGAGIWHPDTETLARIRDAIVADTSRWQRATRQLRLGGDSLKRAPAGYDPEHPLIDDLKRKDFIAVIPLSEKRATSRGFIDEFAATCTSSAPFVRLLCEAVGVPF
jgi:uncharacterized protein (TIGR02453 family)